jgi:hypothetical protein
MFPEMRVMSKILFDQSNLACLSAIVFALDQTPAPAVPSDVRVSTSLAG